MNLADVSKTALATPMGVYAYVVMPFGLNIIFVDFIHNKVEIYVDIVVRSKDDEDHCKVLAQVFVKCREYSLKMNSLKCVFWC